MGEKLSVGATATGSITVNRDRTIGFMGEQARVYATPSLVGDIEQICRNMIFDRTPDGEDSVGFTVSITHMAPTLMGMDVTISVTIIEIDGRKIVFEVVASDTVDTICKGRHERFVVNVEKTKQRLDAKAAKARAS